MQEAIKKLHDIIHQGYSGPDWRGASENKLFLTVQGTIVTGTVLSAMEFRIFFGVHVTMLPIPNL